MVFGAYCPFARVEFKEMIAIKDGRRKASTEEQVYAYILICLYELNEMIIWLYELDEMI